MQDPNFIFCKIVSGEIPSRKVFEERLQRSKLILVSHNMGLIRKMCNFVVHLDQGRATLYNDVEQGVAAYEKMVETP